MASIARLGENADENARGGESMAGRMLHHIASFAAEQNITLRSECVL